MNAVPQLSQHALAIERWEPTVRALVDWDLNSARHRAESAIAGPLANWAIGVKDILDLTGTPTDCGVQFLPSEPKKTSARIVEQLEAQGAYMLAKTVTTSFAYLDPGLTRNPWNPEHTPGGSSMGSAVAVATRMVKAAVGTQTVGSVCRPASFCGVVGFKPSHGLVSTDGCFALAPTFDTIGFFTETVEDMITLWEALKPNVSATRKSDRPLVVGIAEDLHCGQFEEDMIDALHWAKERLRKFGISTKTVSLPAELANVYDNNRVIFETEVANTHAKLWSRYREVYPPKLKTVLESSDCDSPKTHYAASLLARSRAQEKFSTLFGDIDVLLTPSAPGPAPRDLNVTGDPRANLMFTHVHAPVVSLPARLCREGLPLGLQCVAPAGFDLELLSAARIIEDVLAFDTTPPEP